MLLRYYKGANHIYLEYLLHRLNLLINLAVWAYKIGRTLSLPSIFHVVLKKIIELYLLFLLHQLFI